MRRCDICGEDKVLPICAARVQPNYCMRCNKKHILIGEKNPLYKKSSHPICIICGKPLSRSKPYKYCKKCFGKSNSGSNNYRWRTDREKMVKRNGNMQRWSDKVKQLFAYQCGICQHKDILNINGTIVSHHLDSIRGHENKMYHITNGVCLCVKHHKEFHKEFGYGFNTRKQYMKFKKEKGVLNGLCKQ